MALKGLLLPMLKELFDLKDAALEEGLEFLRANLLLREPRIGIFLILLGDVVSVKAKVSFAQGDEGSIKGILARVNSFVVNTTT